jgi:hypothetical protein
MYMGYIFMVAQKAIQAQEARVAKSAEQKRS